MKSLAEFARKIRFAVGRVLAGRARAAEAWRFAALGAACRLACVLWAARRFPPAADGTFYHTVATRIARGEGYTWLWDDGTVTYAAHYPVGYPALVGAAYAVFGAAPWVAMLFNVVVGSLGVLASYWLGAELAQRRGAVCAASIAALSPGLVLYTPALMTEGVTAALYALALWCARCWARNRAPWLGLGLGVLLGLTILVRPQSLLLVPLFGAAAGVARTAPARRRAHSSSTSHVLTRWWFRSLATTLLAVTVCLPWTVRNCSKMDRCVFVSANGGWNLLIGTSPRGNGAWIALEQMGVPAECREVFEEALKDACFENAALKRILADPEQWLGLVPKKWSATFDYPAAPAHYLHMSSPAEFGYDAEQRLVALETVWFRALWALALIGFLRQNGPLARIQRLLGLLGVASLLTPLAWPAVLCLLALAAISWRLLIRYPALGLGIAVLGSTLLIHAVFFGAGRYVLVNGFLAGVLATAGCCTLRRSPPPSRGLAEVWPRS